MATLTDDKIYLFVCDLPTLQHPAILIRLNDMLSDGVILDYRVEKLDNGQCDIRLWTVDTEGDLHVVTPARTT